MGRLYVSLQLSWIPKKKADKTAIQRDSSPSRYRFTFTTPSIRICRLDRWDTLIIRVCIYNMLHVSLDLVVVIQGEDRLIEGRNYWLD